MAADKDVLADANAPKPIYLVQNYASALENAAIIQILDFSLNEENFDLVERD